ncbi:Acetyl esterase/lipase [Actinopolyspora xinjiangensis]|uniref:Acetyl esterase/lipase n=1 Tax=Actinopolyspora xinjiangensis TaxID=405564 RepID=A0A1H0WZI5_9ACTN|nr:alpha/beta hydrolase fold domain-containing protein [Actinopolyspora xinjiangensis]SDP95646.1 Acetyl esterase/lipase [Actinopolyspora xinjiangensis]
MPDMETWGLNEEFGRLAMARKIMAVPTSTGSYVEDRDNAARWIARFGSGAEADAGTWVDSGEHSVVIRPTQESVDSPCVLYIHGGGMVYYSTAVFRPFLCMLAEALQAPVDAFDYLKAPEHTVEQSVEQLAQHITARCRGWTDRQLVLAGDSVGGLLALYISLRILPEIFSRIVLIYPVLDLRTERESYRTYGEGHFLDRDSMRFFKSIITPFFLARDFDPMALQGSDLSRLPDCSIVTAGCDVLRDEGLVWAEHMADRSIDLRHQHFPDLPHDFCLYAGQLNSARRAVAEIVRTAFPMKGQS